MTHFCLGEAIISILGMMTLDKLDGQLGLTNYHPFVGYLVIQASNTPSVRIRSQSLRIDNSYGEFCFVVLANARLFDCLGLDQHDRFVACSHVQA